MKITRQVPIEKHFFLKKKIKKSRKNNCWWLCHRRAGALNGGVFAWRLQTQLWWLAHWWRAA